MKKVALVCGALGVVVLGGCAPKEESTLGEAVKGVETAASNTAKKTEMLDTAKRDIADAVAKKEKEVTDAMKNPPAGGVTTNDKKMEKDFSNVPEQIDMTLAESCSGATITTNNGVVEVELYGEKAPIAVANFCTLAQKGFYDGVIFHRVIKDFMIQGGDPDGIGTGGPGYKFQDELPAAGEYKMGSLAMANAGPNTNGSQFFIVSGPNGVGLPPLYGLFGQVTEGLDVVEKIQNVATAAQDRPVEDVVIEKVVLKMK